ncbi:CinA family protein [Thalassobaculum sp. OXR-137]|uniref:CinA family protein n=1 Tax=Thalassobaculum sp. OXR-137 TaxID=3100173 RepID=UPI002AC9843C|nr:CinA family protein [Thalassobaculum sp. OXR-137]WPZ33565.1 CinA family protein [Thalassobaculum sp. OXR-137]
MGELGRLGETAGRLLRARGETIAVAESSSGGLISSCLLAVPGASTYFVAGGVIYTHKAREMFTDIEFKQHPGMRSSSEPYAALLAETMRRRMETTWGLAETGAAGPQGNRYGDAAGHTCIALSGPVTRVFTLETASRDREANMWRFTEAALDALVEALDQPMTA